jgi:SulP family sulfate permease
LQRGSLVYFNIDHVCMTILDRVRQEAVPPRLVVLDLSAAPYVDLQSALALAGLADELCKAGSSLQVVEARSTVRDRLHGEGLGLRLGGINRFMSVADAVDRLMDGESADTGSKSVHSE